MAMLQRNYLIGIGLMVLLILVLSNFLPVDPVQPAISLASKHVGKWHKNVSGVPHWREENWATTEKIHSMEYKTGRFLVTEDEDLDEETEEIDEELEQYLDAKNESEVAERYLFLLKKYQEEAKKRKDGKYLIYLCDDRVPCSGFADRQRAIVGIYLLSIVTNRTFGMIMTNPAMITDFYVPMDVNWDIKAADLAGKSSVVLQCIRRTTTSNCSFKDLNTDYPQDVVYIRSKNDFVRLLGTVSEYRKFLPKWATGTLTTFFGQTWITLMKPSELLRQEVNNLLYDIAKDMQQDVKIIPKVQQTDSCRRACKAILDIGNDHSRFIDMCLEELQTYRKVVDNDGAEFLRHICPVKMAIEPPPLDEIKDASGYDYVELELVCAQIRLGKTSSIKGDPVLNELKDVVKIWKHLRPYINKGHHLFLASDSQEVRDEAKELFGSRVHVNTEPIVHINKVKDEQDAWIGMKTALGEQLVLSTSCKVLVYTETGYGRRSSMVRYVLTKGRQGFETFVFSEGRVTIKDFHRKPKMLPSGDS